MEKTKYYVTYKVEARYIAEVEAESLEQAKILAEDKFIDANFGEAQDIEGEQIIVEHNEEYIWER